MISRFTVALLRMSVAALIFAGTLGAHAAVDNQPEFAVSESIAAKVDCVITGSAIDLVLVDAGYDSDFCTGARCVIERADVPVAEIILAEATRDRAVGLILELKNKQTILTGDTVKLKII